MKTIERLHEYKDYIRTEVRTEERELGEDLLLLSKFAESAAQAAYAVVRCPEDKKTEVKKTEVKEFLKREVQKMKEQFDICMGYGGFDE